MAATTVTVEIRSYPRFLVYLVDSMDNPVIRRRLAGLGRFEVRIQGGAWRPLEMWDLN